MTTTPGAKGSASSPSPAVPATSAQAKIAELRIDRSSEREESGSRSWGWLIVLGLIASAAGAGYHYWTLPKPVTVQTETATKLDSKAASAASTVLNASGYVVARRKATVSSKVTGRVTEVLVEEGMAVEKDQVLARLDASISQATLDLTKAQLDATRSAVGETQAQLDDARRQLARVQNLRGQGFASDAEGDTLSAQANALEARLLRQKQEIKVAQRQIDMRGQEVRDMEIRAPFAGVAISKDAQPGEMVSPMSAGGGFTRTGICTLVDMTSLEVEVDVSESYINRVHSGQPVQATLDAYPDWQIPGKVITIVPAADRQKATVKVRIGFDKLDPKILPDMGAKVAFQEEAANDAKAQVANADAVIVPASALRKDGERTIVYVLNQGQAQRKPVNAEIAANGSAKINAGLRAGERVITKASGELSDGLAVSEGSEK